MRGDRLPGRREDDRSWPFRRLQGLDDKFFCCAIKAGSRTGFMRTTHQRSRHIFTYSKAWVQCREAPAMPRSKSIMLTTRRRSLALGALIMSGVTLPLCCGGAWGAEPSVGAEVSKPLLAAIKKVSPNA